MNTAAVLRAALHSVALSSVHTDECNTIRFGIFFAIWGTFNQAIDRKKSKTVKAVS